MQDENGTHKVRAALTAGSVGAVTKAARRHKQVFAATDRGGVRSLTDRKKLLHAFGISRAARSAGARCDGRPWFLCRWSLRRSLSGLRRRLSRLTPSKHVRHPNQKGWKGEEF